MSYGQSDRHDEGFDINKERGGKKERERARTPFIRKMQKKEIREPSK